MSQYIDKPSLENSTNLTQAPKSLGFDFRGDGMEYFKIWIVNILLTIVTLGIYSAWATVRNKRYFYSNLYLDTDNFRYLADPITILKGRLIALAALIGYYLVGIYAPIFSIGLAIILFFFIPFFVNQSVAFTNRMSSYKNIQFRFKGSYGQAFMIIYIWPMFGILTLGILYPLALLKANEYFVRNSSYGTSHFDFKATYKDYGIICLAVLGILLVGGLLATFITPLIFIAVYFALIVYSMVSFTNLYYSSLSLVDHKFDASLKFVALAKVILINGLLTIITFGLYLPAAKVRMTKYICSALILHTAESLDEFSAAEKQNIGALGEELGQAFDFT